jgi:hypothetical protein
MRKPRKVGAQRPTKIALSSFPVKKRYSATIIISKVADRPRMPAGFSDLKKSFIYLFFLEKRVIHSLAKRDEKEFYVFL